jgi:hypothetical protein
LAKSTFQASLLNFRISQLFSSDQKGICIHLKEIAKNFVIDPFTFSKVFPLNHQENFFFNNDNL